MKKLFLLDAYAIVYRAYYALLKSSGFNNKLGFNTSAIYGFLNTLHEVISKYEPTHIAVAFDMGGPTFRHEIFSEYKAQREKTPEDIIQSIPIIKQMITAYNIPILEAQGFEADDVIATVARQACAAGFDTYMLTPDKDYCQLVNEHCFVFKPKHGGGYEILGVEEVKAKYSLESPLQVIDLLGLMGDKSDNVPGCPGVGEKTAVSLISQFGSIDNLLENYESLKGALKDKVGNNKEQIKLSKYLVTINDHAPVEFDEAMLQIKKPDMVKLNELFSELDFKSQAKKINAFYGYNSEPHPRSLFDFEGFANETKASESEIVEPAAPKRQNINTYPHKFELISDSAQLNEFVAQLESQTAFCFDTETSSLDVLSAELLGISFSWKETEAYYVAVNKDNIAEVREKLTPIFQNPATLKIGHNCKFDISVLSVNGIPVNAPLFDTMVAHYLIQPEMQHNMDILAETYLNYETIKYEDLVGAKGKGQKSLKQVSVETVAEYSAEDAEVTLRLKNKLEKEIEKCGFQKLFYEIEMPLVSCLSEMELAGVRIDDAALGESSKELGRQLSDLEQKIYEQAGEVFNVNSTKQMSEVLFEKLALKNSKKTKKGSYSTDEEVLNSLVGEHPIIPLILDYRKLKKLLSTYIDALPQLINPKTCKIHTSFNQCVTATGRLSSTNPNLQNIPVRDGLGKEIRKCFIPDDGCIFLSADYSQIELRLMAHLSGDERMCAAFNQDKDIHADTASKIYKVPLEEVTKDMRRVAKTANFGIIYGISAFGLSQRLGVSRTEASQLIDGYFASYPAIQKYINTCIEQTRERGYTETMFGRRRYLPDINSQNGNARKFAERNAINAPIQGSAADIIKIAMVNIEKQIKEKGLRSRMILQVHDELNFNVYPEEYEVVKQLVKEEMEKAANLSVPLVAEIGTGSNWLESH